ncbi:alpha/beta fold hydrolase [Zobellia nedashkovskayae]
MYNQPDMNKITKWIFKFLIVNCILFFIVSLALIYWPIPKKKNIENYDYSSIDKTSNSSFTTTKEKWIEARDGQKLFNRIYPSHTKTICILIHGSGSDSRYLSDLSKDLSSKNIATVITPDLRGHGRNIQNETDIEYIGHLEDDIEDIIAYAKDSLEAKRIILAGHSSGGGLVLRYLANSELTTVDKAIMISPYLGHDAPTVKSNSGGWVTVGVKRWVGITMWNTLGITFFNKMPVLFFNRPKAYEDDLQVSFYSYQMAVNFAPKNYKNDIELLSTKSLVIVGNNDESFYPNKFKEVFKLKEDITKTYVIPNSNHLDIVKNNEATDKIINWISPGTDL